MNSDRTKQDQLADEMVIMRQVMDKNWVVLRALALSDQHPEADVETLLEMARAREADPSLRA